MSIYKKLADIQRNLRAAKNQKNSFGNYSYRSAEDILEAVKPLLGDLALTITDELIFSGMLEDEIIGAGDKAMKVQTQRVYIKATASISDGKETIQTTAVAREASIKKGMDASQVSGSASSYARKYALNGLFSIDDNKDADTNEQRKLVDSVPDIVIAPKKRVDKKQVQEIVALVVSSKITGETSLLIEALEEIKKDDVTKSAVWSQLTTVQKEFVRITKEM
jgi:hypothetical protein